MRKGREDDMSRLQEHYKSRLPKMMDNRLVKIATTTVTGTHLLQRLMLHSQIRQNNAMKYTVHKSDI